jgi:hypothetical protein
MGDAGHSIGLSWRAVMGVARDCLGNVKAGRSIGSNQAACSGEPSQHPA